MSQYLLFVSHYYLIITPSLQEINNKPIWRSELNSSVYAYIYILSGLVILVIAWIHWRRTVQTGSVELATAMLFISIWAFTCAIELNVPNIAWKQKFLILENFCANIFINFFLLFSLRFYHLERFDTTLLRRGLWGLTGISIVFQLTNPLHQWIWREFKTDLPGSNLLLIEYGPLYSITKAYLFLFFCVIIYILARHMLRSKAWEKLRAAWMILAQSIAISGFVVYTLPNNQINGTIAMPFGLTVGAMVITWLVFEDLQRQVTEHTLAMQSAMTTLRGEIVAREELAAELLKTKNSLAVRLAEQSQKLTSLYDLILIAWQTSTPQELLGNALEKLSSSVASPTVCFYRLDNTILNLVAQQGLTSEQMTVLQSVQAGWLEDSQDVHAFIDITWPGDFPTLWATCGFGSCLIKSLPLADQPVGVLMAFWPAPRHFAVEEIALFSTAADVLGVILENARLRQAAANLVIQKERRRLARDLHDSVTQSLHALVLAAETAQHLSNDQPARLERALSHITLSARQALKEMRLLLYELRLASSFEINLVEMLKIRLEAVEQRAGITAELEIGDGSHWPQEWERELYPIAMEALNNALKHARAGHVWVKLDGNQSAFKMQIIDNGCGFYPDAVPEGGLGLRNMEERAEYLGARLQVQSEVGQGTRICLIIGFDE